MAKQVSGSCSYHFESCPLVLSGSYNTEYHVYRLDFTGSPLAKNHVSTTGGTGSIPSQGTNIPNALWSGHKRRKKKIIKQQTFISASSED